MAASTAPRVYPAGRSAMLLGVCAPELAGRKLVIDGRRVSAIAYDRIALLVAFVEPREFEPESLTSLRADDARFAIEARILEQAVERASANGAVIPARALTVYADPAALERAAHENRTRWSRALARLGDKRECVVHAYVGPHVPPGGAPFVARVAARSSRSGRAPVLRGDDRVIAHAADVWRRCSTAAIATRRVRSAPERGALWTASFLVAERDVDAFEVLVERTIERGAPLGVTAHFEGPRLPYSFV